MSKLKENIRNGYFLFVSEWWGLSDNPGATGLFVYPDGSYIKNSIFFKHPENDTQEQGTLSEETLSTLNVFISNNLKESSSNMIHDYGCSIELTRDNTEIKIENDKEVFNKLLEFVPFRGNASK